MKYQNFVIVGSLLWGSMKGIKFQLSDYLGVPRKASECNCSSPHLCSPHWPSVEFPFLTISSQAEISTYWRACIGRAPWEARVCVCPSPPPSMSMTRVEWVPARGPTCSMPCQSLAVIKWKWLLSHCASQAHMRVSSLNTKAMSFIVSKGYPD